MTSEHKFLGFIGTYTKGDSEGIYSFILDTAVGKIEDIKLAAKIDNPTYLTISKNRQYVYAVAKVEDKVGENGLEVWKKAKELTNLIYRFSSSGAFARDFGLRDQIPRFRIPA